MKVYLDIAIGDQIAYSKSFESYQLGQIFIKEHASWVAQDHPKGEPFTSDQLDLLNEMASGYPEFKNKEILFNEPLKLPGGLIKLELDEKTCPKTSLNFYHLCKGDKGLTKSTKKPLHYKSCKMFRLVNGFMIQGGDITRGDGSGGDSIYQGQFNDEKPGVTKPFDKKGLLGMANAGKNSNTSQFFITLADNSPQATKLKGKHVQFGKVVEGLEILDLINSVETKDEIPLQDITIVECNVF